MTPLLVFTLGFIFLGGGSLLYKGINMLTDAVAQETNSLLDSFKLAIAIIICGTGASALITAGVLTIHRML